MECIHKANIPAKGPIPTQTQKIIAHTIASILLKTVEIVLIIIYTILPITELNIRFLAAKKESTKAKGIAKTVANKAR